MPTPPSDPLSTEAAQSVGRAVQKLAAARLGRAFMPLALLFLVGVGTALRGGEGVVLGAGAPLSAGAMLGYGLRAVQRSFGRPVRPWMKLAVAGGVIPIAYGLWVFGWLGLRTLATGGLIGTVSGLVHAGLGFWTLRAWLKIVELDRLAQAMSLGLPGDG